MNSRIKGAFDAVHAEESLKESTLAYLERRRKGGRARQGWWAGQRLAMAACVLLLALGVGGWWLYFIPTASISIEVNPWIELGVNRFDRVVSVEGRNDDGTALMNCWINISKGKPPAKKHPGGADGAGERAGIRSAGGG